MLHRAGIVGAGDAKRGAYDPTHPINAGLALMVGSHPEGSPLLGVELVSRKALKRIGARVDYAGDSVLGGGLRCARLPNPSATSGQDGLCLDDTAALQALKTALSGTTGWSYHIRFWISDAPVSYGHLIAWPWQEAFSHPYAVWEALQRSGSSGYWRHLFLYETSPAAVYQINNAPEPNAAWSGEWNLGVVRDGDALRWYRDGAAWGGPAAGLAASTMRFPAALRPFCLMNRSDSDPYAHSWEWRLSQVRIWSRALSGQEMADAHNNVGVFA